MFRKFTDDDVFFMKPFPTHTVFHRLMARIERQRYERFVYQWIKQLHKNHMILSKKFPVTFDYYYWLYDLEPEAMQGHA